MTEHAAVIAGGAQKFSRTVFRVRARTDMSENPTDGEAIVGGPMATTGPTCRN